MFDFRHRSQHILSKLSLSLVLFTALQTLAIPIAQASTHPPFMPTLQATPTTHFATLVDTYFNEVFQHSPSYATYVGIHDHDHLLEDYSLAAITAERERLQQWLLRFRNIPIESLNESENIDRQLLLNSIQAQILENETVKGWQRDPDRYSSGIISAVFTLMSRHFDTPENRLSAVIDRQLQMPAVLKHARENLDNPPRLFTELAIDQIPGNIGFLENELVQAFAEVKDPILLKRFQASNAAVIDALKAYQIWLEKDLLPRSKGDYRIGKDTFKQKLLYEEMVDLPLDRLLEIGYADLRRNQEHFKQVAHQLDPSKSPAEILDMLNRDHPAPEDLLQSFRDVLGGIREFIVSHKILTLPDPEPPHVVETPPFLRALTFASMDTPGPFETKATEAYFNVTLPDPDGSASETAEYMSGFNYGVIASTAIHEAFPGHYIQFLWVPHAPSKTRKLLDTASNFEGWAHYCEQMMLDAGYGEGAPKLRLGQLQDALLRNARYVVGIKMHTGEMTFDEGVQFFIKEGYLSPTNAERETLRGTSDPTYMYYTLGKLQLLQLREDYKKKLGKDFSLQKFHDTFLKQGAMPIYLIRQVMLGEASSGL